jgi:protein-disulfide isomerase
MKHEIKSRTTKKNHLQTGLMFAQVFVLLILVFQVSSLNGNIESLSLNQGQKVAADAPTQVNNPPPSVPKPAAPNPSFDMVALADDDPVKGDPDAPVTIIEWSDFECPFCSRFYSQTSGLIEENYIDTGKVKLVFRDFPLGFHQNAQKAAEAAECADDQGKFWEMHDKIFENQQVISTENFKKWASEFGINTDEFNECLDSGKYEAEVQKDMTDGSAAGIRGTPGFIINGQLVSGAQPYANFEAIIDAALNS